MPEGRRTRADGHIEVYPLCDADGPAGRRCVLPAGHDGHHSSSNIRYPETSWPAEPEHDRLTPEERAVIEAAVRNLGQYVGTDLRDAVAAYRKATAPPEPTEAFVGYDDHCHLFWWQWIDPTDSGVVVPPFHAAQVWRCTVTPTERVR